MDVRGILGLIIVLVVGLAMTPVISTAVADAIEGENEDTTDDDLTGASKTMIELVPLFYVIGLLLAAVAWVTKGFGKGA